MRTFFYILLFSYGTSLFAQEFRLAGLECNYYPKVSFNNGSESQKLGFYEVGAFLSIPKVFANDKTTIVNTIRYDAVSPSLQDSPLLSSKEDDELLQKISFSLILIQKLDAKWSLIARVNPLLASDFKSSLGEDDLFFQWTAFASRKMNAHLNLGAGIVYTVQTGEPRFLPLLQVKYQKDRHFLDAILPSRIRYLYSLGEKNKIDIGFNAMFDGARYNIELDRFIASAPDTIDSMIYTRANAGALIRFKFIKKIHIELSGGLSTARRYQFLDNQDRTFEFDAQAGTFIGVGVYYIPLG